VIPRAVPDGKCILHVFGAESPYFVEVATPLWALQPFRVGDEGDELKIKVKPVDLV